MKEKWLDDSDALDAFRSKVCVFEDDKNASAGDVDKKMVNCKKQ